MGQMPKLPGENKEFQAKTKSSWRKPMFFFIYITVFKFLTRMNLYAVNTQLNTQVNTQLKKGAALRTGISVPETPYWASCKVVVRRSRNASGLAGRRRTFRFSVILSSAELLEEDNECLWREVTEQVPFAEWVKLELMGQNWHFGARYVRRVANWLPWHSPATAQQSEDNARNLLFELQEDMVRAATVRAAGGFQEWTLIIHAR
jgi:hypothetical protein